MFKDHPYLLPAVGLIKKVDFFWRDFPFDLKVTYFPDGFMQLKRREMGLSPELAELKRFAREHDILYDKNANNKEISELKRFAREHDILYDKNANNKEIFSELLTRISEDTSKEAKEFIKKFHKLRKKIILNTIKNPGELIRWFYEEQGVRRFDAANRFFLVLIDLENLEDSWKLKRNKKLLHKEINKFLDNNKHKDFEKLKISFDWQDRNYATYATTLFILKE